MPPITGKCPSCDTTISNSNETESFLVGVAGGRYVYAIVCKRCRVILGTVGQAQT